MGVAPSQDSDGAPAPRDDRNPNGPPLRRPNLGRRPVSSFSFEPLLPVPGAHGAPGTARPIECVSTLQKSGIVVNALNIAKNSLLLLADSATSNSLLLQFDFDAQVAGAVTVYYCARPVFRREGGSVQRDARVVKMSFDAKPDRLPGRTPFSAGAKQRYRQNAARGLDIRNYTHAELTEVVDNRYPLVIRLDAMYPPDSNIPTERRVTSQTTFATLVPTGAAPLSSSPPPRVEVVAQEVLIDGTVYRILDLFGIGPADVTVNQNGEGGDASVDSTHECVICLTEACTYAVQPCNHLCLCDDCARTLRFRGGDTDPNNRRCPVCRTPIVRLFRIIPESPAGTDEGNTLRPVPPAGTVAPRPTQETAARTAAADPGLSADRCALPSPGTVTTAVTAGSSAEGNTVGKSDGAAS